MKLSNATRHFAPFKKKISNKNYPGHRSSGKGSNVSVKDPLALLFGIVPWLKNIKRTS